MTDTTKSPPLLELVDLGRSLSDGRFIWKGIDLTLHPGDSLVVSGPSGAGKSLLLRAIAGLDPLDQGRILYQGRPIEQLGWPAYRASVIYLQQTPALFEGSVEENLQMVFRFKLHRAAGRHYERQQVLTLLQRLGRDESFLGQQTEQLSGGEQQILAVIRALQLKPMILLLDEATAALDPEATAAVELLVQGWKSADEQRAVVWVTHDVEQQSRVAERELALERGSVE